MKVKVGLPTEVRILLHAEGIIAEIVEKEAVRTNQLSSK
jgi:hypothetical protein